MKLILLAATLIFLGQGSHASNTAKIADTIRVAINTRLITREQAKDWLGSIHAKLFLLERNGVNKRIRFEKKLAYSRSVVAELKSLAANLEKIDSETFSEVIEQINHMNGNDLNTSALSAHLLRKKVIAIQRHLEGEKT